MLNEGGISYGGLFARYSRRRGRLLRTLNPFTGQAVDYSTHLKGDNWLLRVTGWMRCGARLAVAPTCQT